MRLFTNLPFELQNPCHNYLHNSYLKSHFLKSPYWRNSIAFWNRILALPFTTNRKGIKHNWYIMKVREARELNMFWETVTGTDTRETPKSSEMYPREVQVGNWLPVFQIANWAQQISFSGFSRSLAPGELKGYTETHSEKKNSKRLHNLKEQLWSGRRFKSVSHEGLSWFSFYLWFMRVIITSNLKSIS